MTNVAGTKPTGTWLGWLARNARPPRSATSPTIEIKLTQRASFSLPGHADAWPRLERLTSSAKTSVVPNKMASAADQASQRRASGSPHAAWGTRHAARDKLIAANKWAKT